MDYDALLAQVLTLLQQEKRLAYTYCISRRNFFGDKQLRVL
jgi:hypothetical protein